MEHILICFLHKLGILNFVGDEGQGTVDRNKFNMKVFNNRLFYQKLIFFLTEKTNQLDYNYNWYKRGPYSPSLTRDLFEIEQLEKDDSEIVEKVFTDIEISDSSKKAIESITNLKEKIKETFGREWITKDLEILASLLFINKYTSFVCRHSKEETILEFKERKAELAEESIEQYWDILLATDFT